MHTHNPHSAISSASTRVTTARVYIYAHRPGLKIRRATAFFFVYGTICYTCLSIVRSLLFLIGSLAYLRGPESHSRRVLGGRTGATVIGRGLHG